MAVKEKTKYITDQFAMYLGDCCQVLPKLPKESVGHSVFSPPFVSLYSYSDHPQDMGNCKNYDEFFVHFGFVVEQLHRLLLPGRVVAVHCSDLPTFKSSGEEIGLNDFPGDLVKCFKKQGFIFHSRHCIWKDPLVAATRTKAIGLAHKQIVKDSSMCRMGIMDMILAFRKKGVNPKPITHKHGLTQYYGAQPVPHGLDRYLSNGDTTDQSRNKRSHWIWQRYASPVWMDIRQTKVLSFKEGKDKDDQRHICPLQGDVIVRCLELWSNPGDIVLTPFMGIGSEVYYSVKHGRKGIGVELKPSYFRQAKRNLDSLVRRQQQEIK